MGGSQAGETGDFYVALLESGEVQRQLLRLRVTAGERTTSLAELLLDDDARDSVDLERMVQKARRKLPSFLHVAFDPLSSVVTVRCTTHWPSVSYTVADATLSLVNRFNLDRRQSQAGQEVVFLNSRVKEVGDSLGAAERRLQQFLEANREYSRSARLVFEVDRLQRAVALYQSVLTSLVQGVERARMDAVREVPVISIVDAPTQAMIPDRRHLVTRAFFVLVGLILATAVALLAILRLEEAAAAGSGSARRLLAHTGSIADVMRRLTPRRSP